MTRGRLLLAALAAAAVVLVAGRTVAALYVEQLWYRGMGLRAIGEWVVLGEVLLRGGSTLLATLFLFINLYVVRASVVSFVLPRRVGDLEFGEEVPGSYLVGAAAAIALAIGSFLGIPGSEWPRFALAAAGPEFGELDPYFERDLGFYVGWLPAEIRVFAWAEWLLIATSLVVGCLYALTPSVRWRGRRLYVSEYVRRHVSVLCGLLLLLFAWAFRLEMYQLLLEGSGAGGLFSSIDLHVRVPGNVVLAAVATAAGLLVVFAGFMGQIRLAFAAVTLMLLLTGAVRYGLPLALGGGEARSEVPFQVTRDGFTRRAFGGDRVASLRANEPAGAAAATGISLWDPAALMRAVDGAAGVGWVRSGDAVDAVLPQRGFDDGTERTPWTVTRVAAWSADVEGAPLSVPGPADTGGALAAPSILPDSAPDYRIQSDAAGALAAADLAGWPSRLAHAWALQNFRILLGALPSPTPVVVLRPSVHPRIRAAAPFLSVGEGATPAVVADTLFWVVAVYATSDSYPMSQPTSALGRRYRYLHPAGHAVVNSVTGSVRVLAVVDPEPILQVWIDRFPELFLEPGAAPAELRQALTPPFEAARLRALTFARLGPTALERPAKRRAAAVALGGDSLFSGPPTPFAPLGGDELAIAIPVIDEQDRVAGVVVATGPSARSRWIPADSARLFWGDALDRLRRADSTSTRRDSRPVRGPVRIVPGPRPVFVQPTYRWPARGEPTLAGIAVLDAMGARTGGDVHMALGATAPRADAAPDTAVPSTPRQLYEAMRAALRRGDWPAFGAAFDSLGRALGARSP